MITGNKGEWSELYAFFRLLADGKVHAANESLDKLEDLYLPILSILRSESDDKITKYNIDSEIIIYLNETEVSRIPRGIFDAQANNLFDSIISKSQGTFSIPESESFMNHILCNKISAPSNQKSDLTMQIIDINTGYSPIVGFSIKSELGSSSTLLNAGKTTNFVYSIKQPPGLLISDINEIHRYKGDKKKISVRDRMKAIYDQGGHLNFSHVYNAVFRNNLILIDSIMDQIIAETLIYYYRDGISKCSDLVYALQENDPIGFGNKHAYSYKFKKLLVSVALGMKPATAWDGIDEANGGYLVVKKNGDVLAYHIYNRDKFEDYLLNNTRFETASTSRHEFGYEYSYEGKPSFNLNLQIRFL